jgi:NADPH:quinone reductase-like Zn-dependent oxidoreductase
VTRGPGSSIGLHRVVEPAGVLPQAAWRLDASPAVYDNEVRIAVERLNLDAASFRQLTESQPGPDAVRAEVLRIVGERGKMHNPVTGSGGMLVGVVDEIGPDSPLGLRPGQRVATLVSLTLTPLTLTDGLGQWDGRSEQVPAAGSAILFGRSIASPLPADLPTPLALAVLDVCGAPALTDRVVRRYDQPRVLVIGAGGKSGSLSMAAARAAGAHSVVAAVPTAQEAAAVADSGLADEIVQIDARDPVGTGAAVRPAADVTVVCVDVPGAEGGALLATAPGGTVIFFSMATSFSSAALGAEGLAADVTMLIGNGYAPGHAEMALELLRSTPGVHRLFTRRLADLDLDLKVSP